VRLETELYAYQPDLIILYQGHNDLFNTLARANRTQPARFDPRPEEIPADYPWERWLEHHSLLYHKLGSRFQAIRFGASASQGRAETPVERYRQAVDSGAAGFARGLRMYLSVARSLGVPVVVPQVVYVGGGGGKPDSMAVAVWAGGYGPAPVIWDGYARYDAEARSVASELGATHIPASDPELWRLDGYAPGDPVHFNDRGAWRFAAHLARTIRALPPTTHPAEAPGGNR
jgi:lysophospholipase L1-like esterase